MSASIPAANPLEHFVQQYVDELGGAWDAVEPQVYDLLLPAGDTPVAPASDEPVRVAFDPEAVPEHRGSQFLTYGSPLLDGMLEDAQRRWPCSAAWRVGDNLHPHDLSAQAARQMNLRGGERLALKQATPMDFVVQVHWFIAAYVSDQKEQDSFIVAIDCHDGRQVRQLDRLLDRSQLIEEPLEALASADRISPTEAYAAARRQVVRSVAAAANIRRRELEERLLRQEGRMVQYYSDLREEIEQQMARAIRRDADTSRLISRRVTIDREEKLRISELRHKHSLHVDLKLAGVLEVHQPRLVVQAQLQPAPRQAGQGDPRRRETTVASHLPPADLSLVWDPLTQTLDAPVCPVCRQTSYAVGLHRGPTGWACHGCAR